MHLDHKLESIDKDIADGLRFKAVDRLRNMIKAYPNQLELREKLAELYYEAGFIDAAGRYWMLSESQEPHVKACVETYEKSVGYSGMQILNEIQYRGERKSLGTKGLAKLESLEQNSKDKTGRIPEFKPQKTKAENPEPDKRSAKDQLIKYLISAALLFLLFAMIIGIKTVIEWLI